MRPVGDVGVGDASGGVPKTKPVVCDVAGATNNACITAGFDTGAEGTEGLPPSSPSNTSGAGAAGVANTGAAETRAESKSFKEP